MLLGGQLMSMGFLAELILAYHAPRLKSYSIADGFRRRNPRRRLREAGRGACGMITRQHRVDRSCEDHCIFANSTTHSQTVTAKISED